MLSFHPLLVGGNPFTATSIYSLISFLERKWGVHFADGRHRGSGQRPGRLDRGPGQPGVAATPRSSEILVERPRARACGSARGERITADIVVSNADAAWTYRYLVPPTARAALDRSRSSSGLDYSMSLFVWYFGTKPQYTDDVPHHTILLGPRYRELLDDIFERKVLAEDFSLYLHRPDRHRPVARAAGLRRVLRALAGAPPRRRHRLGAARPSPTGERSTAYLADTVLPGLEDESSPPACSRRRISRTELLSFRGAALQLRADADARAPSSGRTTGARTSTGLYLVGAGTHPGAGVPGVLSSARVLDCGGARCRRLRLTSHGPAPRPTWPPAAAAPGGFQRPSTPPRGCCPRRVRDAAAVALRLLPRGRRRGRRGRRRAGALVAPARSASTRIYAGRAASRCPSTARFADVVARLRHSRGRCPTPCSRASRGTRGARATRPSTSSLAYAARVAGLGRRHDGAC